MLGCFFSSMAVDWDSGTNSKVSSQKLILSVRITREHACHLCIRFKCHTPDSRVHAIQRGIPSLWLVFLGYCWPHPCYAAPYADVTMLLCWSLCKSSVLPPAYQTVGIMDMQNRLHKYVDTEKMCWLLGSQKHSSMTLVNFFLARVGI